MSPMPLACAPPLSMVNLTRKKRSDCRFAGLDPREPLNAGFAHHSCLSPASVSTRPGASHAGCALDRRRRGRPAGRGPGVPDNDDFFNAVRINTPGTPLGSFSEAHDKSERQPSPARSPCRDRATSISTLCAGDLLRRHGLVLVLPARQGPGARHGHHVGRLRQPRRVDHPLDRRRHPVRRANLIEGQCNGPVAGLDRTDVPINGYHRRRRRTAVRDPGRRGEVAEQRGWHSLTRQLLGLPRVRPRQRRRRLVRQPGPVHLRGGPSRPRRLSRQRRRQHRRTGTTSAPTLAGGPTQPGLPRRRRGRRPRRRAQPDKCPSLNPDRVNRNDRRPRDGCPDNLRIAANTKQLVAPTAANGILIGEFFVTGVPKGARVQVKCKRPNGSRCGKLLVKRAAAGRRASAACGARPPGGSRSTSDIEQDAAVWLNDHGSRDRPLRDREVHSRQGRAREADLQAVPLHQARHQEAAQGGLRVSAWPHSPRAGGGGRGSVRSFVRRGQGERRGRDDGGLVQQAQERRGGRGAGQRGECAFAHLRGRRSPS